MTKQEAYKAMEEGHKVRHRYYTSDEYIFLNKNGLIESENGYVHGDRFNEFWIVYQKWENGWSIIMSKTVKITLDSIKGSDMWMELAYELKFEQFKNEHPEMDEEEIDDKFYTEIVIKKFKYGEYADIEIEFDENFNIVGGKIL